MSWEMVGSLPVDAGCIMLIDPCYTEGHDEHRAGGNWNSEWYTKQIVDRCYEGNGAHEISGRETGPGSGMVVESGYGDGHYPVYVKREDGRISEVRVVFIGDESENEDGDDYGW